MTDKPVVLRERAEADIDETVVYYTAEGGADLAFRFIDALETAIDHIGKHPATGSPRYAVELDLPGLRFWRLKRSPYLIFYVERESHVDAWRLLHGERDIPAWLGEADEAS